MNLSFSAVHDAIPFESLERNLIKKKKYSEHKILSEKSLENLFSQIMVQIHLITLILLIMHAQGESRTVSAKLSRVIMKKDEIEEEKDVGRCDELPLPMLNDILGAAFNSRCV